MTVGIIVLARSVSLAEHEQMPRPRKVVAGEICLSLKRHHM